MKILSLEIKPFNIKNSCLEYGKLFINLNDSNIDQSNTEGLVSIHEQISLIKEILRNHLNLWDPIFMDCVFFAYLCGIDVISWMRRFLVYSYKICFFRGFKLVGESYYQRISQK